MSTLWKIAVVENSERELEGDLQVLRVAFPDFEFCGIVARELFRPVQQTREFNLILVGFPLEGFDSILAEVRELTPEMPVVLYSRDVTSETLAECYRKESIKDFLHKDRPETLTAILQKFSGPKNSENSNLIEESQKALILSERRFRSLFLTMLDGYAHCRMIYDHDEPVDFVYLETNPAFTQLTGLSDVKGKKVSVVIPDLVDTNPELFQVYGRVARTGIPEKFETFVAPLKIWFSIAVYSPEKDEFVAVFENITKRKNAETTLIEAETHYRLLAENSADVIWLLDLNTMRFLYVSPSVEKLRGYTAEEVLGMPMGAAIVEEDIAVIVTGFEERVRAFLAGDESAKTRSHDVRQPCKDGTVVPTEVVTTLVKNSRGEVDQLLGVSRNITERVRAEEERHLLESQIQQSQKLESLGSLAGGIAHDINNVLAAILSLTMALKMRYENDIPLTKTLESIENSVERGRDLVRGVLDFVRKRLEVSEVLDLNALVSKEADLLRRTMRQKVQLTIDLAAGELLIKGEAARLASALMNICVNAIDAMPHGGVLKIRTKKVEAFQVELAIEDNGEGMSPETLARATEPFFTTKLPGKGTGLGLAQVYNTVRAHGGTLEIKSQRNIGTTIFIRLPLCQPSIAASANSSREGDALRRPLRILLVDDEEFVRLSEVELLRQLGHEVDGVSSGFFALERLSQSPAVDLVILDHNMPELSGAETLDRLRLQYPHLPVIMATGFNDSRLEESLSRWPDVGLLTKPFSIGELREALSHV